MESPFSGGKAELRNEKRELEFRKDKFEVVQLYYRDEENGTEFTTDEIDQVNINLLYNQYRAKYGVPFPDQIREIREMYDLPASKMSEILGLGINTYRQYEQGEMPTVANSRLIMAAKDPEEFRRFIELSHHMLSDREYEKYLKKVDGLIAGKKINYHSCLTDALRGLEGPNKYTGYREPSLDKIANVIFFLNELTKDLWKTKLNKLLFYCDFGHFKRTGFSITGLPYRAIQLGPVPSEYEKLYVTLMDENYTCIDEIQINDDACGEIISKGVDKEFDRSLFTEVELEVLAEVRHKLSAKSTSSLVEISHKEAAWEYNKDERSFISYEDFAFKLKAI